MFKSLIICFLLLIVGFFPAYAQNKDLVINADNVSYLKDSNLVEASGSVEVIHKDVIIHGNHVIYNTASEEIYADHGFDLWFSGMTIEGRALDYKIPQLEQYH